MPERMTSLIITLGAKGAWTYVAKLIDCEPWDSVYVITEEAGLSFSCSKQVSFVLVKEDQYLWQMVESVQKQLDNKIHDTETAVNFVSGSGKMHMAAIAALLKLGLGIRLIALTPDGLKEI